MAKTRKKKEPLHFPDWLVLALACPTCGVGCALTKREHGMVCLRVPAHTGLIRKTDWHEKVLMAHKIAVGRNLTDISVEKAYVLASAYLQQQLIREGKRS